jgi:hypothetical protein
MDLALDEHVILGLSKEVWTHTAFGPKMHHLLPCISLTIPWFGFWPTQGILMLEHVVAPKLILFIDMVTICDMGAPSILVPPLNFIFPPTMESFQLCLEMALSLNAQWISITENYTRLFSCAPGYNL